MHKVASGIKRKIGLSVKLLQILRKNNGFSVDKERFMLRCGNKFDIDKLKIALLAFELGLKIKEAMKS